MKSNEEKLVATSNEIQGLKEKLAQAEGRLAGLNEEAKSLSKKHDELRSLSKSQKMKFNLLIEKLPALRSQKETLDG